MPRGLIQSLADDRPLWSAAGDLPPCGNNFGWIYEKRRGVSLNLEFCKWIRAEESLANRFRLLAQAPPPNARWGVLGLGQILFLIRVS